MMITCATGFLVLGLGGFGFGGVLAYYASSACDTYFHDCYEFIPTTKTVQRSRVQSVARRGWIVIAELDNCILKSADFTTEQRAIDYMNTAFSVGMDVGIGISKKYPDICVDFNGSWGFGSGAPRSAAKAFIAMMVLFVLCIIISIVLYLIKCYSIYPESFNACIRVVARRNWSNGSHGSNRSRAPIHPAPSPIVVVHDVPTSAPSAPSHAPSHHLAKMIVRTLPENETCPISLEPLKSSKTVCVPQCGHVCGPTAVTLTSCPICRIATGWTTVQNDTSPRQE